MMNPTGRQRQCAHAVHRILAGRSVLHGSLFREALGIYGHGAHAGIATWPWNMESLKVNEPPKWVDVIKDDQGSLQSLAELLERAVERGRERSKNPSSYILLLYIYRYYSHIESFKAHSQQRYFSAPKQMIG